MANNHDPKKALINIDLLEQVARTYEMALVPLRELVGKYGCEVDSSGDGLFVLCPKRGFGGHHLGGHQKVPVREWLAIEDGSDEASRRKANVYRRTGMPWHPHLNSDSNIALDGSPCADDDR